MSGCTGVCCAAFTLPRDPAALGRDFMNMRDGTMIAAMVLPLTGDEARERHQQFGGPSAGDANYAEANWYTCRYWDEDTRLCRNYEGRPAMCSRFPYEQTCPACDCTLLDLPGNLTLEAT